jgi:HEAT repeat protein
VRTVGPLHAELEQLRDRADLPTAAAELIRSGTEHERIIALLGLREAGSRGSEVAEPAAAALADTSPKVRKLAARTLGAIGWVGAGPALEATTHDDDTSVRTHALLGLLEIDATAGIRRIAAMINDTNSDVGGREAALAALEDAKLDELPPALGALVTHPDVAIRSRAVAIIGYSSSADIEPLRRALRDSSAQVRLAAVLALMRRQESPPADSIAALFVDPDPQVRQLAVRLVVRSRGPRYPASLDLLPSGPPAAVAEATAVLGGADAIPRIRTMIVQSTSTLDQIAAWHAVGLVGQSALDAAAAFVDPLSDALRAGDERVRRAAFDAASSLGPSAAMVIVERLAEESDPLARAVAVQSLSKILGSVARPQLRLALNDQAEIVRRSAMEALGRVGTADDRVVLERTGTASPMEELMRWEALARLAPAENALSAATRELADPAQNGRLFTQWYAPAEDLRALFSRAGTVLVYRDGDDTGETSSVALMDDGRVRIGDQVCAVRIDRIRVHEQVTSVWGYRGELTPDPWSRVSRRVLETTAWAADL